VCGNKSLLNAWHGTDGPRHTDVPRDTDEPRDTELLHPPATKVVTVSMTCQKCNPTLR
jgi:hypothetical protein